MPDLSDDHHELIRDLSGIVCDYPYGDPEPLLTTLAEDAARTLHRSGTPQGRRELTGYTLLLHATCWYVAARIFSQSLFASYSRALDGVRATLSPASCTCPDGTHPAAPGPEEGVVLGVYMLTETGRAVYAEDYEFEGAELAAFDCEAFLTGLAEQAANRIREARQEIFGHVDLSHLDARFARGDGALDIVAMQEAIRRTWLNNTGPVALWSARRWLSGQVREEDRIGLFLCMWMGIAQTYEGLPPSYARTLAEALATIDLDASCEHPRHPWSTADANVGSRYRAVVHLYAPDSQPETPVPAELSDRELWECPVQYAELARRALEDLRGWRTMRGGDDEDWAV